MPSADEDDTSFCFGVLGPVQVRRQGSEVDLGARQQRLILALLLANAGRPVGIGDIVEVLWGRRPPQSAVNVVHRYVGALRRLFEPSLPARSAGRWLLADAAGYRMRVDSGNLDLLRLRMLAAQARSEEAAGRFPEAMSAYEAALELWRGPCGGAGELAAGDHLAFSVVDHECADLARESTALALRLDRVRSILPVLRRMAEHRPLDEALQAQLLLALSADGQQAEAIALHRNVRRRLADELGVDPGEELREAYRLVLRQDSAGSEPPDAAGSASAHRPATRTPPARTRDITAVLPAQLPADLPSFTGRDDAQRRTLSLVNGHALTQASMPVLSIDGIPGIGKTSLAVHLGHQLADAYPDGQLYVDLQGFDPDRSVLHPAEALQGFLNALGVPDTEIPASHHARSGLYRSVLTGRRMLIVLDNAHSVQQVRSLLPGAPGCLVLVTSRKRLTGLATAHGAHLMTLDILSPGDARSFLASRIGAPRTTEDPAAVDEIIERCGRLPLALAVVAARALTHPDHRLSDIARELRDAQGSLDGFSADGMDNDIRAIFSWSYRMLSARASRMFRLLALHPGPDVAVAAMAALAGVPVAEARVLAGDLVGTGLLAERTVGRFITHDLIRAYAQELVHLHEDEQSRDSAFERLTYSYRHTAYQGNLLLHPVARLDPPEPVPGVATRGLDNAVEAVTWFAEERQVLKAVVQRQLERGQTASAWQLALVLQRFNEREGWWHDWAAIARACLQAAIADQDDLGIAHMSRSLAGAEHTLGNKDSVAGLLHQSLDLFTKLGRRWEQALIFRNLGQVSVAQERHLDAIVHYERALDLNRSLGNRVDEVAVLCCLADAHKNLGRPDIGIDLIHQALPIAEAMDDFDGLGQCFSNLAECLEVTGDLPAALAAYKESVVMYRRNGWRTNTALSLRDQGDVDLALGNPAGAREAWQEALDMLGHLRLPLVTELEDRLAKLDPPEALRAHGDR